MPPPRAASTAGASPTPEALPYALRAALAARLSAPSNSRAGAGSVAAALLRSLARAAWGTTLSDGKHSAFASTDMVRASLCCLVACVACFISFGVNSKSAENAIAGSILAVCFLGMILIYFRFERFAVAQRRLLVSKLLRSNLPVRQDRGPGATLTERNGEWVWIPSNLLVEGDIVDLRGTARTPAACRSLETQLDYARDALVPQVRSMRALFEVLEAPLVGDVAAFLAKSDEAQRTSIGLELYKVIRSLQIAGVCVAIFGLALGAVRLALRPDGLSWSDLLLTRPSVLLILLPPMNLAIYRSALETLSAAFLLDCSSAAMLREWLFSSGNTPMPLCPSALLHTVGSVTALCALDEDTVLASHPIVEEVFLLKGEGRTKIVDCCADASAKYGIRFEDPRWAAHVDSLKPIGLACALGTTKSVAADPPPCMRNFAWTIGFAASDVDGFSVLTRATVLGESSANQSTRGRSWSVSQGRPSIDCMVLSVPTWQQPANASFNEGVHMICWGHPSLLLPFCNEYWDGESIWMLDEDSRQAVRALHAQWAKEDFDCVAFAYAPLVNAAAAFAGARPASSGPSSCTILFPDIAAPLQDVGAPLVLSSSAPGKSSGGATAAASASTGAPTTASMAVCTTLSRGLVFTGLVASRDLPRPEVTDLVSDLHKAGVRFVYFSPREPRRSRVMADKMGLETDWNTSISLQPDGDCDVVDWELKAHMPRGIAAIEQHVREVDDVPLRVPVFTDSAPDSTAAMVGIMRHGGDVVACLGTTRGGANLRSFVEADVGMALMGDSPDLSESFSALACSFAVFGSRSAALDVLGEARVRLYNYKQSLQGFCALGVLCATAQLASLLFSAPDLLTPGHALFLVIVQFPLVLVPVAIRGRERERMLYERMPWKKSAAPIERRPWRYAVYLAWRIVPAGLLCCALFLWQAHNSGFHVTWSSDSLSDSWESNAATAQSIAMLSLVWTSCIVSLSFANRTEKPWQLEPGFYAMWILCSTSALVVQFAYNCVYARVVSGTCASAFQASEAVWLVLFLAPVFLVPLLAWPAKAHDQKHYRHTMQMLRLTFETKLGQFSPR